MMIFNRSAFLIGLYVFVMSVMPSTTHAAISATALHQQRFNNDDTSAQTTSSFTPGNGVLLVAAVTFYETSANDGAGAPTITIADSEGLNWTTRLAAEYDTVESYPNGTRIFTAPVTSGAPMTITVDVSQAAYQADTWDVQIFEVRGYNASTPVGLTAASGMGMTGSSLSLGGTTDSSNLVLALALTDNSTSLTITQDTGWTEHYDTFNYPTQAQSQAYIGATSTVSWAAFAAGAYSKWAVAIEFNAGSAGLVGTLTKPPNSLGLVGYWKLDEGSGTSLLDRSGNGNNFTFAGGNSDPVWVSGKFGSGLQFDDANDQLSIPHNSSLDLTSAMTISLWVKKFSLTGWDDLVSMGDSTIQFTVATQLSNFEWGYENGAQYRSVTSSDNPITTNTWHHVLVTWSDSANNAVLYVDGIERPEAYFGDPENNSPASRPAGNFFLGEFANGEECDCVLDEIRVYNRTLSAKEAITLYRTQTARITSSSVELQRGSSLEQGIVGHWTFDGSYFTNASIFDSSLYGNSAYFDGGATSSGKGIGRLGQGLYLSNAVDRAFIPGTLGSHPNVTLSLWARIDSKDAGEAMLFSIGDAASIILADTTDLVGGTYHYASGWRSITTAIDIIDGNWHHLAFVINPANSVQQIWVDGAQQGSGTFSDTLTYSGTGYSDSSIGGHVDSANSVETYGTFDDVRAYSRALTAQEITHLYNLGRATIRQ